MLSVYTRHYPPCPQTDIHYRRCRCPKWIRGRLEGQGLIRKSAHTRNWSRAERLARELERRAEFPGVIEVKEAVRAYLADQAARKLSPPTLTPMRALFERHFLPWCEAHQLARLDAIRTPQLKDFRCTLLHPQRMIDCCIFSTPGHMMPPEFSSLHLHPFDAELRELPPSCVQVQPIQMWV